MSILASIAETIGSTISPLISRIKNLEIRVDTAESEIEKLGGQVPPPTGNLVITDVQWKNITEIPGIPQYIADPDNDGNNGGEGTASQMFPVKIIVLEAFALGNPSIVFPVGTILHGTGIGGSDLSLQRMEDPNDPRDYPYSGSNQSTGNWDWGYIADRGIKWEYAKINTIVPTGEAEVTGINTLTKIGGVDGYNTGGSSTNFIGGETNGYFQFQLSGMMKIGVVYEDSDYNVDTPFSWKFLQTQYSHALTSTDMPFTDGDWFRIRHYASENKIYFQRKQEVFGEDNESIGQGYVTEFIHPTLTNGNDLFLDVSLREIGASINDPKIARTE